MIPSRCWTTLAVFGTLCAASPKRGLVYVPNEAWPQDDAIWIQHNSVLTWYYTYGREPHAAYNPPASDLEFVPMMWGMGDDPDDTGFLNSINSQLDAGVNIRHVLAFNEPDMRWDWGGSDLTPAKAARGYVANFVPLRSRGIKLGLPSVSGAGWGIQWLREFEGNCTQLLNRKCEYDFVPVHWYDNFGGFMSHIDEAIAEFPDARIWVTEYAFAHQNLEATKEFYRLSAEYLDNHPKIDRYSYFGSFRSQVSNVGPNATFLNNGGLLTNIGSLYLGFGETGLDPISG